MKAARTIMTIPAIEQLHRLLHKIDRLRLPEHSRRDVESILVRQVGKQLDRYLPWQTGHGKRTASVAITLGEALGLSPDELHQLKLAAYLHDIGLLTIPKKGWGDAEPDSYEAIQNHPRAGATILEPFAFLREASILIAHHHERWDGTGYPYGIRGPFIPLGARILSIADAFDAIHVPNVHDDVTRNLIALRILRISAGTQFDPELVDLLCSRLEPSRPHYASL